MARRFKQGKFTPRNPHKYVGDLSDIVYRSSWELKFLDWCDRNPSVINYNSEGIIIPYFSQADNKNRRYFVDFIIKMKKDDGDLVTLLIEIKPYHETVPPKATRKTKRYLEMCHTYQVNQDKWHAAEKWAQQNGCIFKVLNEFDLGITKRKLTNP